MPDPNVPEIIEFEEENDDPGLTPEDDWRIYWKKYFRRAEKGSNDLLPISGEIEWK